MNHYVLLTGYTEDYWIAKNSWSSDWGEDGYIKLPRNEGRVASCFVGSSVHLLMPMICNMVGCLSCDENETVCSYCMDRSATIVDGVCVCP